MVVKKSEILVSSTGVIGELFDPNIIIKKIKTINKKSNTTDILNAAKAIMTTDTYPKTAIKKIKIGNKLLNIFGIAKGSGMIMPNMGTMLSYIFIESYFPKRILKKIVKENLDDTFNSISVDSDTSTSDTLIFFSLNRFKIDYKNKKNINKIKSTILNLMKDLSLQIIKDGEGLSKLIKVRLEMQNQSNKLKILDFVLQILPCKNCDSGEDANWGRVIAAIG